MGDPGRKERQSRKTFGFDGLFGGFAFACGVAENDGPPGNAAFIFHEGDHVKVQEAILRVEDLHFTIDDAVTGGEFIPIESAHLVGEVFAEAVVGVKGKHGAGGIVEVNDASGCVCDDDALLDGIEDRLEKAFFSGEINEVILDVFRLDALDAFEEFFEKG